MSANSSRASADVAARALEVDGADLSYHVALADLITATHALQFVLSNSGKRPVSVNGVRITHGDEEAFVTLVDLTSPIDTQEFRSRWDEAVGVGRISPTPAQTRELPPGGVDFLVVSADVLGGLVMGHGWCQNVDEVGFDLVTGVGFVDVTPPEQLVELLRYRCGDR